MIFCEIPFVKLRAAATELSLRPGDLIQARGIINIINIR